MTSEYPPPVQDFHDQLLLVPGVLRADTSITSLEDLPLEALSQPELAELPHAVLRRSPGITDEALIQVEFEVEQTLAGWRALEFIAWAVKDMARGGELVQVRPVGLPPIAKGKIQLGETLRFVIDIFVMLDGSVQPALDKLVELTGHFRKYHEFYGSALR